MQKNKDTLLLDADLEAINKVRLTLKTETHIETQYEFANSCIPPGEKYGFTYNTWLAIKKTHKASPGFLKWLVKLANEKLWWDYTITDFMIIK